MIYNPTERSSETIYREYLAYDWWSVSIQIAGIGNVFHLLFVCHVDIVILSETEAKEWVATLLSTCL